METYFYHVADLNYQLYVVDGQGNGTYYGSPFRNDRLNLTTVQSVIEGNVYHGMAEFPKKTFMTGHFANELSNSIGVPLEVGGKRLALFMRPDIQRQFSEIHLLLSVMLALTVVLSIVLMGDQCSLHPS